MGFSMKYVRKVSWLELYLPGEKMNIESNVNILQNSHFGNTYSSEFIFCASCKRDMTIN